MASNAGALGKKGSNEWLVPVATVAMIFVTVVPVLPFLLDLLPATSITLGVVVLLSSLYILRPVEFSMFPTLLLFLTLFRISLNMASSRQILLHGNEGATAAGSVIASFGQFVVGGNYVVGFVILLALISIQYLVINHGAVRTAEVAARFTLDAMPGKQLAILLDTLAEGQPKLVDELVPRLLTLGELQRVLQLLLHEQVSIRDLPAILETLLDTAATNKNPIHLLETVRQALARSVVAPLLGTDRKLRVLTLDPAMEEEISRGVDAPAGPQQTALPATPLLRRVLEGLQRLVGDPTTAASTILLCHSPARFHLRRLLEPFLPRVVVLAPAEIPPGVTAQSLGVIR
jgi:flagellar biosynthesis component FlhA